MIERITMALMIGTGFCVGCGSPAGERDASVAPDAATDSDASADGGASCARNADCDDGVYCNGSERCEDARCVLGSAACEAPQVCIESLRRCLAEECLGPEAGDFDGDGRPSMACGGDDCDDDDRFRYPGGSEVCDVEGHDEDCDPDTYGFRDADGDGEPDAACCNGEICGSDCDDMRPGVNPTVPEVCGNGLDDDCDGAMDEGLRVDGYEDSDGDGWGDADMPRLGACPGDAEFSRMAGDCDEENASRNPGATEACDEIDNDCDGTVDEDLPLTVCYRDGDGDGYGRADMTRMSCACGAGWSAVPGDCHDGNADVHPNADWRPGEYCPLGVGSCAIGVNTSGDWNCDGAVELRYTRFASRCLFASCTTPDAGWCDGAPRPPTPDCATAPSSWCECSGSTCTVATSSRSQQCR